MKENKNVLNNYKSEFFFQVLPFYIYLDFSWWHYLLPIPVFPPAVDSESICNQWKVGASSVYSQTLQQQRFKPCLWAIYAWSHAVGLTFWKFDHFLYAWSCSWLQQQRFKARIGAIYAWSCSRINILEGSSFTSVWISWRRINIWKFDHFLYAWSHAVGLTFGSFIIFFMHDHAVGLTFWKFHHFLYAWSCSRINIWKFHHFLYAWSCSRINILEVSSFSLCMIMQSD